jgi:hypothetical protein
MAWIPSGYTDSGMEWVADNDPRYLIYSGQMYDPMQSLAANLSRSYDGPGDGTPESGGMRPGGSNVPWATSPIMTAFRERELAQGNRDLGDYGGQEAYKLIQQLGPNAGLAEVNAILQQQGLRPFSSVEDWQSRNRMLPGNETGSSFGDFVGGSIEHLGDTASDLWSEPGFRNLALTAAGGAYAGSQYAGANAAAGGAAPTAMTSAPSAVAGSAGAPGTALFSTPASSGVNAFGGAFSTPAMTTYAGPTGTALGGFSAPAVSAGTLGLSAAAPAGSALSNPAPIVSGGAAGVGGAATTGGGIAGILSSPVSLGIAGGALLGGLGGSEQAGTITVEEGLPDWLRGYAKPTLDRYATDIQNYQTDPYGVLPSAMQEFQKTINGQYLDPSTNKYLGDYFRLGAERIKGSLSPSFGHMNAFGQHSGYNEALSRGLGDLAVGLYGGAYEKERNRQSQMTGLAPNFLTQSSTSAFAPYQQYLGTIGSLGKKKDQPFYENPFGNILGGALTGGALANMYNFGK